MDDTTISLHDGYTMRRLTRDAFDVLFTQHARRCFGESVMFSVDDTLSDADRANVKRLKADVPRADSWCFGLYDTDDALVGWTCGRPISAFEFTMNNSAIFPEHRRRGLYSAILTTLLPLIRDAGFQFVTSRHNASNNAVIIPKLKAGFLIHGLYVSDQYGVMLQLIYYFNEIRGKMHEFRTGHTRPDDDVRRVLDL